MDKPLAAAARRLRLGIPPPDAPARSRGTDPERFLFPGGGLPRPLADRLWEKARKTDGCWYWIATVDAHGYGLIGYQGGVIRAHRAAWIVSRGSIPAGMSVLHHCDEPRCVNPAHLWLGTHADNMADAVQKGRLLGRKRRAVNA